MVVITDCPASSLEDSICKKEGMKTAFVLRSTEYGENQTKDLKPSQDWDFIVQNLNELADELNLPILLCPQSHHRYWMDQRHTSPSSMRLHLW